MGDGADFLTQFFQFVRLIATAERAEHIEQNFLIAEQSAPAPLAGQLFIERSV